MTQKKILKLLACAMGLFGAGVASAASAPDLKIYAGPQSIAPREIIHITVQAQGDKTPIELSFLSDAGQEIRTGLTTFGLVSFDVPANARAGHMQFTAKAEGANPHTALVYVHAGSPKDFSLSVKPGRDARTVDVSSDAVTDRFNNLISDLAFVSLEWIDATGMKASQNLHLNQGRIISTVKCPRDFTGGLRLRAAINTAEYLSSDLSQLCIQIPNLEGEMTR